MLKWIDSIRTTKPKNKFSIENLQYMYQILVKNPIINEQNTEIIIETLRQTAELMIWGDQHNPEFFDFFLEKSILSFFLRILSQKTSRDVKIQLIQTLSILVENIRNEGSLYYILSNNHINELITHKFDFSDDEITAYYISLLKTLSLKLNKFTIQFFFNSMENDFPLYTEAIKFFNHRESMIRIAVRTLTLNVYKVEDESVRNYVLDKTAAPYFSNIVWFIRDQCYTLDSLICSSSHQNRSKLEDFVEELLDYFYYLQDIFNLGMTDMSEVLSDHLLKHLLLPQFIGSLVTSDMELEDRLTPLTAVFLMAQVFHIFNYKPLINTLAAAFIHPNPELYTYAPVRVFPVSRSRPSKRHSLSDLKKLEENAIKERQRQLEQQKKILEEIIKDPNRKTNIFFEAILSYFQHDDRIVLGVICLLYAIAKNTIMDKLLLEISGLFPHRLQRHTQMLAKLCDQPDPTDETPPWSAPGLKRRHSRSASLGAVLPDTAVSWAEKHPLTLLVEEVKEDEFINQKGKLITQTPPSSRKKNGVIQELPVSELKIHEEAGDEKEESAEVISPVLERKEIQSPDFDEISLSNSSETLRRKPNGMRSSTGLREEVMDQNLSKSPISNHLVRATSSDSLFADAKPVVDFDEISQNSRPVLSRSKSSVLSPKSLAQFKAELDAIELDKDTQCKNARSRLVDQLLKVLLRGKLVRLVTLQMSTLLLRELTFSFDSSPDFQPAQFSLMEAAYLKSISTLREGLVGSLRDIFLELFEHELSRFKQIVFDKLIMDFSALLLPIAATPLSGVALPKRFPSGEAENVQKAIQGFLVLREFKYTMLRKKDDFLPLQEEKTDRQYHIRDAITFDGMPDVMTCHILSGANKKRQTRYLVIHFGTLLVSEPDVTKTPKASKSPPSSGIICNIIPLQSIEMENDPQDERVLHVTSHPTTSQFTFNFEDAGSCQTAQELLECHRKTSRSFKMDQIEKMLAESSR
eukprot:TRINITY_DN4131_c0_g1_i1.p1 TRINITY_DN4131_c0_g1~~TRINITY_DN4131_c0_g1_i1.p1  ORF type:complete len:976 (-),score=250.71 TRINITY_DN4131_c0_g1_i1:40-2967(-)